MTFQPAWRTVLLSAAVTALIAPAVQAQWSIGAPGKREAQAGKHRFVYLVFANPIPGKEAEFNSALARAHEAIEKTKWSTAYTWLALANGGAAGTYVLILTHKNWSDFEPKPDSKPFLQMLIDAFGPEEAESINKRFDASIDSITTEIDKFRADLSYMPAK